MNKFFSTAFIIIILLSFCVYPPKISPAEGNPTEVVAVALRNWPPQFLTDDKTGEPAGFAIDIMNKVAELSDLKVRYVLYDNWPKAFEALRNNEAVLAPNMGITSERLNLYDFTTPYETFRISVFVRSVSVDINEIGDLDGRKVGVVKENQGLVIMREKGGSELQIFDSMEQAFMNLISGDIDALVYPEQTITGLAIRAGLEDKIKIVGKPLQEIKRAMAVSKGNPELFQKLDNSVKQLIKTPEYQMIYEKWYGKPKPFWNIIRVSIVMGIVLGLTIASMLTWRYVSILKLNRSLSEAEERFRGILENTNAGYFFLNTDGKFQRVNKAWLKMHGYPSEDEVIGKHFSTTQIDQELKKADENVKQLIDGKPILTGEFSRRCMDGSIGYHTFSANPVIQSGKIIGLEGFIIDTTKRRQAEKEKEKLESQLQQAQKMESIGTLAGGIAHDFNNLLYVVMGNISLAQDDLNLEIETSENLKEAEKACIMAKKLTARLITFSKGGDPIKKMMPINGLLKDTVISVLSGSNIKPKFSISDDIRQVNIDEGRIKQVVRNIVVNAKEAMDDNGKLTVSCENVDITEKGYLTLNQGEYIKISVKDQGCGIFKENFGKIFDPYFSTKDMGGDKGQGLGLTVCYSIIQKHGGLITVESEPQTGSTFSVYLPTLLVKEPDLQKSEEKPAAQEPVKKPAKSTGKILLMDDEKAIRTFLGKVINRLGYDVETCIEGKEAVEIYKKAMESKEPFDVVILDLTNKIGMGGQETMKRLLEINPDVKGIIITGYSDDPAVANFRAYGFSGFIIKPATRDELRKVIKEVLLYSNKGDTDDQR